MIDSPLNVMIIGCGNIAGGYDLLQKKRSPPLGHAKAFLNHGKFNLLACIDPDFLKCQNFQKYWNFAMGLPNMNAIPLDQRHIDVISICSPTKNHASDILEALELRPKLIFCEKPLTTSIHDSNKVIQSCIYSGVQLAVNFSRRWSPQVQELKQEFSEGLWGSVRSVSCIYNKGILNNGSHMIDLLIYLFGELSVKSVGRPFFDFSPEDPTIDITLQTDTFIPIHINTSHSYDFSLFEMRIVTEKCVIDMEDGGERWRIRQPVQSHLLPNYRFLNKGKWIIPKGDLSLTLAINNIYDSLLYNIPLLSTGTTALQTQILCEQILSMVSLPSPYSNLNI